MKKPEWPGIATAAALVCAGVIIFAIWRDPDGFKLKDWQTFMAACVALVAGTMAYRGAMAKVEFDRYAHDKKVEKEELGAYLRLRSTLSFVQQFATVASTRIQHLRYGPGDQELEVTTLHPRMVFDVNEAWSNLDIFEPDVAQNIADMKTNLDAFYIAIADYGADVWKRSPTHKLPVDAERMHDLVNRIAILSRSIVSGINRDIGHY